MGCVSSVRRALTPVEGISDFDANPTTNIATFKAIKDVDVVRVLDELSKTNEYIDGWSQK